MLRVQRLARDVFGWSCLTPQGQGPRHRADGLVPGEAAAPRGPALVPGQKGQKNLLHALAAALRRVASDGSERDGVLDVLEEARDGCGPRIARPRLIFQNVIQLHILLSRGRQGPDRRELVNSGFYLDLLRRGVDLEPV